MLSIFKHLIALFFLTQTMFGSTITGSSPFIQNTYIYVLQPSSRILNTYIPIDSTLVDEKGVFSFNNLPITETDLYQIQVKNYVGFIYLAPHNEYTIQLEEYPEENQPIYRKKNMRIVVLHEKKDSLNTTIDEISFYIDSLLYKSIMSSTLNIPWDSVYDVLTLKYNPKKNDFLQDYIHFSIAHANYQTHPLQRRKIIHQYFHSKAKIHSTASFIFFKSLYSEYFQQLTKNSRDTFQYAINNFNESTDTLILQKLYSSLSYPKEKNYALWIFTYTLTMGKETKIFKTEKVLEVLKYFKKNSTDSLLQKELSEIINYLTRNSTGSKFPNFSMIETHKNFNQKIPGNHKKNLVLFFFTSWSESCQKELMILEDLCEKYEDVINCICISLDENEETFEKYVLNKKLVHKNMQWMYFNHDFSWLNKTNILSVPTVHLLDHNLCYREAYTPNPSEGLEKTLYSIKKEMEENKKIKNKPGSNK